MVRTLPGKVSLRENANGTEIPGMKFPTVSLYLSRLSSFTEFQENANPFIKWKAPLVSRKSFISELSITRVKCFQ